MQPEHLLLAIAASGNSNDPMRLATNLALINDGLPGPAKVLVANQAITTADQVVEEQVARVLSTVAVRLLRLRRQEKVDSEALQKALPGVAVVMAAQQLALDNNGALPEATLIDIGARAYANARPMLGLMAVQRQAPQTQHDANGHDQTNGHDHTNGHQHEHTQPHPATVSVYESVGHDEQFKTELRCMSEQGLLKPGALQKFPYFHAILKRVTSESSVDGQSTVDGAQPHRPPIEINID